jgi:hypothetical protein
MLGESLSFLVVFWKSHPTTRAKSRAKACDQEFGRLTIDASAAELKQEKSLVAELGI